MVNENTKRREKEYLLHDNLQRFFLTDMLRRKSYLKNLTLEDLDNLVRDINSLVNNLSHSVRKGEIKIEVEDKHNRAGSNFFKNIILHNVLEIPIDYRGTENDFKNMLKKRWGFFDEIAKKI